MKDENGELIPEGTPIIDDEAVHELATQYLDISQTNVNATLEYARLMDMTWSDDADGWVDWNEYSIPKHNFSKESILIVSPQFCEKCSPHTWADSKNQIKVNQKCSSCGHIQ